MNLQKQTTPFRHSLIWLSAALLFSAYYVLKTHVGPDSSIADHADLKIAPPFVFRLLLPWLLSAVLPHDWLDLAAIRILVAALFVFASVWLMPTFLARITGQVPDQDEARRARLMMLVVLVAHYSLPRNLKFYYVYDFPAITFYQLVFLALTARSTGVRWAGVALAAVFAVNRETVGVAVVHAFAWHAMHLDLSMRFRPAAWGNVIWQMFAATVVILLVRKLIAAGIDHPVQASFSWMEGDQIRILANLKRMVTKHHHGIALLWFGAGAIIWLPRKWRGFNVALKGMFVASLPVFVFFCIVGNFVELRMFNELLPLLAAALAFKASQPQLASAPTKVA